MQKTTDDDDSSMAVFSLSKLSALFYLANIYCTSTCVGHWDKRAEDLVLIFKNIDSNIVSLSLKACLSE